MIKILKEKLTMLLSLLLSLILLFSGCNKETNSNTIQIFSSTGEYTLIESFSPVNSTSLSSGSIMAVGVTAKKSGITVKAEFNGETIELKENIINDNEEDFENSGKITFSGSFNLPFTEKDTAIGQVKFTCSDKELTETYYSGIITVLKGNNDGSASPVGETYIAEVLSVPAETFNGDTVDDNSLPTNSYLPVGTVDYCSGTPIINGETEKSYRLLRYGKRVYDDSNIKVYEGKLPTENSLSVDRCETEGKYTVLSFFTDWKAPFTVELKEQEYINSEKRDYRIKEATFSYVEIRFMYCTEISGQIEFDKYNPLFTDSSIRYEDNCTVLTLNLKNEGKFYGWRAEYDEDDCLILRFLEPTRLYSANNEYGFGLYDKVIVIDAGHGGNDYGGNINGYKESNSNLSLAFILEEELEAAGATVVLTRRDDSPMTTYERFARVLETEPDFLISIHRNGGGSNGFGSYYFHPYCAIASDIMFKETAKTDLYRRCSGSHWHYFFLNRLGICPSVLTENGFLDDDEDRANMQSADHQRACAKVLVNSIVEYFKTQHF